MAVGAPKVVAHVGKAKDLLIKKIARETAGLQRDLEANSAANGGARLVNMSQGVPCLPIFEAAHKAMTALLNTRRLPYSDVAGEPDVRESAALFVNVAYNQTGAKAFSKDNVIITAGAIQAIYNCLALSIEGPQDVVATPLPAYSIYQQQTNMLRGTFTTFGGSGLRVPTPESLRELFAAINGQPNSNQKLRVLVLCLPNNPTGAMLSVDEARELCATLDALWEKWYAHDSAGGFSVVLDEVYVGITAKPAPSASLLTFASARLRNGIFLVSSCSKGLGAMPGARAAWITAPNTATISELAKIQLVCTGNASTISQAGLKGSLDFLRANPGQMDEIWRYYQARTALVVRRLQEIAAKFGLGTIATESEATFYVWCDFASLPRVPGKSETDLEFVSFLKSLHSDATTGLSAWQRSPAVRLRSDLPTCISACLAPVKSSRTWRQQWASLNALCASYARRAAFKIKQRRPERRGTGADRRWHRSSDMAHRHPLPIHSPYPYAYARVDFRRRRTRVPSTPTRRKCAVPAEVRGCF